MKASIKELCKREGLKSQVKVGDMRESISKYHDMLAEESAKLILAKSEGGDEPFTMELCLSLKGKINKILKKNKSEWAVEKVSFDTYVGRAIVIKAKTKKA